MKKTLISIIGSLLLLPSIALATPTSWDFASGILQPLQSQWAAQIKGSSFVATSTASASRSIFTNASTTGALSASVFCLASDGCRTTWPTGGGSGGGTWSTTTSSVAGQLVNYPNNTSDVVAIGSNSTTTAEFWFDPNTLLSLIPYASSTFATFSNGFDSNGTSTAYALRLDTPNNVSASESVGGVFTVNRGTALGPAAVLYNNSGTGGGRLASLVCDNTTYDTQCFHVRSDSDVESTVNVLGAPSGKGIVKIGSNAVADADSSGLSIDTSLSGFLGQGIFLKGNASGKLLNFRTSVNEEVLTMLPTGFLGLGTTSPYARLSVVGQIVGNYFTATSTSQASTFPYASTTAITVSGTASTSNLLVSNLIGVGTNSPSASISVNGGPDANTAYFWNNGPSGKTRVTIRGGAGESSSPVLNIVDNTNTQQAYIRNDGYIAGTVIGTMNDQTVVMTQNSTSDEKPGIDFNNTAMTTWSSNGFWWGAKDTGIARRAAGILEVNNGTAGTLATFISSTLGIGTSTPGTLLSLGDTGNSTINLTPTGTSTLGLGINLRGGCYAINDTCITSSAAQTSNGHATSTGDAALYNISVDANDTLQVWYETHRNRDNVCTSGSGTFGVNFILKQSTYNASTTIATTGSNNDIGSGCSLSFFTMFTATTTESISIQTDQTDGQYSSVMYTLFKR